MEGARLQRLSDSRLHLQHGPIDVILRIEGPGRVATETAVWARFQGVLAELAAELPVLRAPVGPDLHGPVARRMRAACLPHAARFITPMAAVAGAVADALLAEIAATPGVARAWVNNGGDAAFLLPPGDAMTVAMAGHGAVRLSADQPWRGIATSGWRGRSHSLGIADAVTVVARDAAAADAAATMIANAVDLPGHPAITRTPARDLAPDSDLGARPVTTAVGPLTATETARALQAGYAHAATLRARGLIGAAALFLNGQARTLGPPALFAVPAPTQAKDPAHA